MASFFTNAEIAAIDHRLGADDAVTEVLADAFSEIDVAAAICAIGHRIRRSDMGGLSPVERAVLRECVEGSTWFGVTLGQTSESTERRALKTLEDLAEKLETRLGFDRITVPSA